MATGIPPFLIEAAVSPPKQDRLIVSIVDVFIQRQTIVQAVNLAVIHDEIHTAGFADFLGLFLNFFSNRVLVSCSV